MAELMALTMSIVARALFSADVTGDTADVGNALTYALAETNHRLLTFNPVANKFGDVTITVTVTKSGNTMVDTFVLMVQPSADQPSVTNGSSRRRPGASTHRSSPCRHIC